MKEQIILTIKDVMFISIWNGGFEVESEAKWNEETGEVFAIQTSGTEVDGEGDELEFLEGQFIELSDSRRLEVIEDGDYPYQIK